MLFFNLCIFVLLNSRLKRSFLLRILYFCVSIILNQAQCHSHFLLIIILKIMLIPNNFNLNRDVVIFVINFKLNINCKKPVKIILKNTYLLWILIHRLLLLKQSHSHNVRLILRMVHILLIFAQITLQYGLLWIQWLSPVVAYKLLVLACIDYGIY